MKKAPPRTGDNRPAETPGIVRIAVVINALLLVLAIVIPRRFNNVRDAQEGAGAAVAFALPMALILIIGAAAAIRAYILARRQDRPVRWTAFLPASIFLLGIAITLGLVFSQSY
jgi:Na+/H+ antiporter NhaD/arsenite permease-like protein